MGADSNLNWNPAKKDEKGLKQNRVQQRSLRRDSLNKGCQVVWVCESWEEKSGLEEEVRSQSGLSLSPPLEPTKIKIRIEGKLKRKVKKKKRTRRN
jgi:hypothetical protein